MRRKLKKGDPCPCCGNPIPTDDEVTLSLLTLLAEKMGLPLPAAPVEGLPDLAGERKRHEENTDHSGGSGSAAPAGGIGG